MQTLAQLRSGELIGIHQLKLSCQLTQFPSEIMKLADSLEILDLSGNQLSELPDDFAQLTKLRILFCSDNNFTELPEVLGRCPELSMIGFKANRIRTIPAKSLPAKLRWLTLTDNAIETLPETIGACTQLQKLLLAGNQLQSLPETLSNCKQLALLRIAANQLDHLPAWLLSLPHLSWLAYSGNPFSAALERQKLTTTPIAEIAWQRLALEQTLGEGASGVIHRASYLQTENSTADVAVKLFKGAVTSDGLPHCEMAAAIAAGQHPNLIAVLGKLSEHPTAANGLLMALVNPELKNLAGPPSFATCTRDTYPENTCFDLAVVLQIAQGIAAVAQHLHKQGIMHGDLYGHNILCDHQGHALLGDFGAASFYPSEDKTLAAALQRLEVRAFACLLEELLERCNQSLENQPALALLNALKTACLSDDTTCRPLFDDINQQLLAIMDLFGVKLM